MDHQSSCQSAIEQYSFHQLIVVQNFRSSFFFQLGNYRTHVQLNNLSILEK